MDAPANLILLKSLLLLTLGVHFVCLGVIVGGASAAVTLDILGAPNHRPPLAVTLLDLVAPGLSATLLGLTTTLILLGVKFCYPFLAPSGQFWVGALAPLLAGLALLALYQRLLRLERGVPLRPCCGLAGITLTLASAFLLCCGSGLLVMPEKLPFIAATPLLLLSWSGTARYIEFTCLALAATGAVILLIGERTLEPVGSKFARRLGGGMALFFLIALPPALLFGLFNLPAIALSGATWLLAAAELATAAVLAFILFSALVKPQMQCARSILALFTVLFAIWVLSDHLARENALDEVTLGGIAAERSHLPESKRPPTGAALFDRVCAACHRFDKRLIGPPLNAVVPKYRKDPEALEAFIRTPVKRDPAYPAMPFLPLTDPEIEAVAAYVLEKAVP